MILSGKAENQQTNEEKDLAKGNLSGFKGVLAG
jgi:hypothetical protein